MCSLKLGKEVKFENKLDIIRKHARNVYENKIVNCEEECIVRWKSSKEYQHVKFEDEYKKYVIRGNLRQVEEPSHIYLEGNGRKFVIQDDVIKHCILHLI